MDLSTSSQVELEELFSKYQLNACIREEFIEAGVIPVLLEKGIDADFGIAFLTQMVLRKRATIEVLVGALRKHFQFEVDPSQACADAILQAIMADLADYDPADKRVVVRLDITEDVQARLDMLQYPLPMIEAPRPVKNNKQTGYHTIRGSIILKDNHHDEDVCLDHINRLNSTPLRVNPDVVAFIQNSWKNLDKPKDDESFDEFQKRREAFRKYDAASREVLEALMVHGNRFFLTHRYDKRGRTYCQGYHVSYQAADWNKACIEFADAEPLNAE